MPEDANPRKRLGDFEIIRELGRGGMGIVYEARQVSLNRKVALKVISGSLGLSANAVLRFQREAEAAGKLHHTNIVPIYSTGDDEGSHYYAMELIEGPSLHQVIRSLRSGDRRITQVSGSAATLAVGAEPVVSTGASTLESRAAVETPAWISEILGSPAVSAESTPARKSNAETGSTSRPSSGSHLSSGYFDSVATMIAGVADGLDYAHENGVIHRDIKPANLLLSRDGRVSINDFGLARMLEQPGMTMSGEFVGSPLYMSPEQITAERAPLDHRTDVYSLGATLYELLTLKPVFPGQSREEVIAQILHKEPERPRRQNPKVPVDLETICLKAMEKDPDRRYQWAGQLAEDLRRFVGRHAISARRVGPLERCVRWARKNKALTAMALFVLTVVMIAAFYVYTSDREHQRSGAKSGALMAAMSGNPTKAIEEIRKAGRLGAEASWVNMLLGQVDLFLGEPSQALEKLENAVREDPESVMARSLRAECYLASGRWAEYVKEVDALEEMPEAAPEDYLFKGQALRLLAPDLALRLTAKAVQLGGASPVARLLRAQTQTFMAQDGGDLSHAVVALEDLKVLSRDLGANPALSSVRLEALLTAYHLSRRRKASQQAAQYLQEARAEVEYLEGFPRFYAGNTYSLSYFSLTSNFPEMLRMLREATKNGQGGYLVDRVCPAFYSAGTERIRDALGQLDRVPDQDDPFVLFARVVLLADSPSGRQRAEHTCDAVLERYPMDSPDVRDIEILFLLGRHERRIREYARKRAENMVVSKYWRLPKDYAEYVADDLADEEFLRRAGDSERNLGGAYFDIGLRQLARGNRIAANECFEKSAACGTFLWSGPQWSRAFMARMKKDPTWPDWLPAKPADSEAK